LVTRTDKRGVLLAKSEVFPNAPLQLVAFELIFQPNPNLAAASTLSALGAWADAEESTVELAPQTPPRVLGQPPNITLSLEPALFRIMAESKTLSITLWRNSLTVEHSEYERYGDFRMLLLNILTSLLVVADLSPIERLGLRYIDELHVPADIGTAQQWEPYINKALLAPLDLVSAAKTSNLGGTLELELNDDRFVNVRYATVRGPATRGGAIKLRPRPSTSFCLLDTDGFWLPPGGAPLVGADDVLKVCDDLHRAVDDIFDLVVTEHCRNTVLRKEAL